MRKLDAPFNRGLAWYRYKSLEEEFISATKYFPFEKKHSQIWSEFFSDLLTKIGNSVDSFFRNMLKDTMFDSFPNVIALRETEKTKKRNKDINYFRDFFEPIYQFSGAEVDIAYGLTFYDSKYRPFGEFETNQVPIWWNAYNHVKHTWFDCIEEATLENVVASLGGLFLLNILHKESQEYLIKYQDVMVRDFQTSLTQREVLKLMKESIIGIPNRWNSFNFRARTPLFTHTFRVDTNSPFAEWFKPVA